MKSFIPALSLAFLLLFSCAPREQKVMFLGEAQGTYYAVTYFDREGRNFQPEVDSILKAFDRSVSMWVPESLISRINQGDTAVRPDDWFADIFHRSAAIAEATDGAFDFTVGPLVNAWGFGFRGKLVMDSARVDSLRQFVDYRKVSMGEDRRIEKPEGFRFDFNAIAQGYSVDLLGRFLEEQGIRRYLVDIGGEVLARGAKPDGSPWVVGIENPAADSLSERTLNTRVKLENMALATSGSYRKYREEGGVRYSHTIDPRTGYPVRHSLLSVSVLAGDAATADGYATAFMVMGYERSREFIASQPGLEAFFIVAGEAGTFSTHATPGLQAFIIGGD